MSYNLLPSPCTCELVGSANGVRRPVQKIISSVNRTFGLIVTPVVGLRFITARMTRKSLCTMGRATRVQMYFFRNLSLSRLLVFI